VPHIDSTDFATSASEPPVHSLYWSLLEEVLIHPIEWRDLSRPPDPLAELGRIRRIMEEHLYRSDPGWAIQAVADQLSYDVALIRLARREGIEPDPSSFDLPGRGRNSLASALERCGISLPDVSVPFRHVHAGLRSRLDRLDVAEVDGNTVDGTDVDQTFTQADLHGDSRSNGTRSRGHPSNGNGTNDTTSNGPTADGTPQVD